MRPYHVVVWGATGFTGKLVCEHIAKSYTGQGQVKWAIAGRSKDKLEAVRADLTKINAAVADVDLLVADVKDAASVNRVTAATTVLLTTAGPYARIGRPIVEACINTGTHYCDLTGEPNFIRSNIDDLHDKARDANVRIVHCCGFDSVPSEMVVLMAADYLHNKYNKKLGEVLMVVEEAKGGASGGTVESGVNMVASDPGILKRMAHPYFLDPARSELPLEELPDKGTVTMPKYSKTNKRWTGPFVMAPVNTAIVRRSNALLGYGENLTYDERMPASSYLGALVPTAIYLGLGAFMYLAAKMPVVRNLAPKPGAGPSREQMESGRFLCKAFALSDEPEGQTPVRVETSFGDKHRDPGYLGTARMILEAALCMALQMDDIHKDPYGGKNAGGILTPASAMGLVYLERLKKAGFDAEAKEAGTATTLSSS